MPDLLTLYEEASVSKTGISKLLTKWSNYDLLILDEFLLNDLTQAEQLFLFELIERRYDKASTMLARSIGWRIGTPALAAVCMQMQFWIGSCTM